MNFQFGARPTATAAGASTTGGFQFGLPSSTSTGTQKVTFGNLPASNTSGTTGLGTKPTFGTPAAGAASNPALSGLLAVSTSSTASAGGFTFGNKPTTTSAFAGKPVTIGTSTTGATGGGFTFGSGGGTPGVVGTGNVASAGSTGGFSFAKQTATGTTTSATPTLSLGTAKITAGATGLSSTTAPVASSSLVTGASSFSTGGGSTVTTPTTATTAATTTASTVVPSATTSLVGGSGSGSAGAGAISTVAGTISTGVGPTTFRQLEDNFLSWKADLDLMTTEFSKKAKQLSANNVLLQQQGDRLSVISDGLDKLLLEQERVKLEADQTDEDLNEIERLIVQLETERPPITAELGTSAADQERDHMYEQFRKVDATIKRLSDDTRTLVTLFNQQFSDDLSTVLNNNFEALQWAQARTKDAQRIVASINPTK